MMRISRSVTVMLVTTFLFINNVNNVNAGQYLFDLCMGQVPTDFFRLSVSVAGPAHIALNGTSTNSSTSGTGSVVGNGVLQDFTLIMTLRESHVDEFGMSESTYHILLDLTTGSGPLQVVGQDYSIGLGGFEPKAYDSAVISVVPCP